MKNGSVFILDYKTGPIWFKTFQVATTKDLALVLVTLAIVELIRSCLGSLRAVQCNPSTIRQRAGTVSRMLRIIYHVLDCFSVVIQAALAYAVMLAVMAGNAWVFITVLGACTFGYFITGWTRLHLVTPNEWLFYQGRKVDAKATKKGMLRSSIFEREQSKEDHGERAALMCSATDSSGVQVGTPTFDGETDSPTRLPDRPAEALSTFHAAEPGYDVPKVSAHAKKDGKDGHHYAVPYSPAHPDDNFALARPSSMVDARTENASSARVDPIPDVIVTTNISHRPTNLYGDGDGKERSDSGASNPLLEKYPVLKFHNVDIKNDSSPRSAQTFELSDLDRILKDLQKQ